MGCESEYMHPYIEPKNYWYDSSLNSKIVYKGDEKVKEYKYDYQSYYNRIGSIYDMPLYRYRYYNIWLTSQTASKDQYEYEKVSDLYQVIFAYKKQEYTSTAKKLAKETETTYFDDGNEVVVTKDFTYDKTHILPIEEKITASDGSIYSTKYEYPNHHSSSPYPDMVKSNILSPVINKEHFKDNIFIKGERNAYSSKTTIGQIQYKTKENPAEPRIIFSYHDQNSLPREITKDGTEKVVHIRNAYNQIVAMILNAGYIDVRDALGGQTVVDRISKSTKVKDEDMTLLNNLRIKFPQAHISTYTYDSLIGIVTYINPSGIKTNYNYSDMKLERIYDSEGNTIESYDYNYSNK